MSQNARVPGIWGKHSTYLWTQQEGEHLMAFLAPAPHYRVWEEVPDIGPNRSGGICSRTILIQFL